jgi:glycosyltransferase involved in cell wall biosynthesis
MRSFFSLICFLGIAFLSFLMGAGKIHSKAPSSDFRVTGEPSFAIVLYAHNAVSWCERALHSIFEQEEEAYRVLIIDDGSMDGTFERMQRVVIESGQEGRVIAIQNPTQLGKAESFQRLLSHCQDQEILIPLDATEWFTHPNVLSRLKEIFQNKDIWSVRGEVILYPSYEITSQDEKSAFYAGLLKQGKGQQTTLFAEPWIFTPLDQGFRRF